jgi:hypothetical protein
MINKFRISKDEKTVSWKNDDQEVKILFQYKIIANHIKYLDQVIVESDVRESGSNNLIIYNADGSVRARPDMPVLKHGVGGVYSVWFDQGKRLQTLVLMTDEFSPYDTACTFDLETYEFSKFHPTK